MGFCTCRWMEINIILRYPWPQTDSLISWYKFRANRENLINLWLDTSLHAWAMNKTCFEGSASLTLVVAGIRIRLMTIPSKWAYFYTPQIFKRFALRLVCHFKKYRKAYLFRALTPGGPLQLLTKRSEHKYLMSYLQRLVKTDCPTNLTNSAANNPSWRAAETQRRRSFFIIRISRK